MVQTQAWEDPNEENAGTIGMFHSQIRVRNGYAPSTHMDSQGLCDILQYSVTVLLADVVVKTLSFSHV